MPGAINPLLQSPASPSLPGATPPPPPAGGMDPVPTAAPQPMGPPPSQPTDFEQAQDDETDSKRRHDYRRIRHTHVAHQTLNWRGDKAIETRDKIPPFMDKVIALVRKPDLDRRDVTELIAGEMHNKNITADQAVTLLNSIPADNERNEIHDWAMAHLRALIGLHVHLVSAYPHQLFPKGAAEGRHKLAPAHEIAAQNRGEAEDDGADEPEDSANG